MKHTIKNHGMSAMIASALLVFGFIGCMPNDQAKINAKATVTGVNSNVVELKTSMRKLWMEHAAWTRNVIICLVDDAPGTEQAVKRLLQNQVDIGTAIKTYYGEETGKALTELLYTHINVSADVIKAAKASDTLLLAEVSKKWYANADEIAVFLSKANPNWSLADMKMMMNDHLKLTTEEVTKRVEKNYEADIMAYDKVQNEIIKMSDMLSDGIVKQFPDKF